MWVDRFFRHHIGRLTTKRTKIIAQTAPEEIDVELKDGGPYYQAAEEALYAWLCRFWKVALALPGKDGQDFAWTFLRNLREMFGDPYEGTEWQEVKDTARRRAGII